MKKETQNTKKRDDFAYHLTIHIMDLLLKEDGRSMAKSDLITRLEKGYLRPFERKHPEKFEIRDGNRPVWLSDLDGISSGFGKLGLISKDGSYWHLTVKGKQYLEHKGIGQIVEEVREKMNAVNRERAKRKKISQPSGNSVAITENSSESSSPKLLLVKNFRNEILDYASRIDPYDYQGIVAVLLRAMGYHVPYIAPRGPDGGVDVVAYSDHLGAKGTRIKVQIKRQKERVGEDVIELLNAKIKGGEIGLVVSHSGFTGGAKKEARDKASNHIRLIDGEELIELWCKHYNDISEADRAIMPIQQAHILDKEAIEKREKEKADE